MKPHGTSRIVGFALLAFAAAALVVLVFCVLEYRAIERAPNDGFLTLFAVDDARRRVVLSAIACGVLVVAGGVITFVSRRLGKK